MYVGLDRCPPALYQGTAADVIGDRASRYVYGPIKLLVHGRIKTKSDRNIGRSGRASFALGLGGSFDWFEWLAPRELRSVL